MNFEGPAGELRLAKLHLEKHTGRLRQWDRAFGGAYARVNWLEDIIRSQLWHVDLDDGPQLFMNGLSRWRPSECN